MATPKQQEYLVRGQAVWGCIFCYIDTMSLRCAVKLRIPDIITSHGRPISLTQISDAINIPSLDTDRLSRVLTVLVRRGIFSATPSDSGTLYGPTAASELLLANTEKKSPAAKAMYHSGEFVSSLWQHLDDCVKDGSSAIAKRYGMDAWSYMSANPDMYELMQQSLAGTSKFAVEALKIGYLQNGLKGVGSLVDVGGGSGTLVGEIVKEFPHIKGTNLDLPTVVAFASQHPGVTHVAGNMLVSVPPADAVLIKQVLHDWNDEDTVKILTNCRKAIPKKTGKVIILEMILDPYGNDPMDDTIVGYDLFMLVGHGTKERTEAEWKKLLEEQDSPVTMSSNFHRSFRSSKPFLLTSNLCDKPKNIPWNNASRHA